MKTTLTSTVLPTGMPPLRKPTTNSRKAILLSLLMAGTASVGSAAVIAPQAGGGAAIDPSGNAEVDAEASGSALLSTFESLDGRITQVNWTGIGGTTGNTIDGSDVDVRIDHSPGFSASASTTANYNTGGGGNGYLWTGTDGQLLTISFGTQGGSFTNDRTVQAAGLALLNFGSAYTDVTITYFDSGDSALSTQSFSGTGDSGGEGGADFFTGYTSGSQNIAYLTIDITRTAAGDGTSPIGLDAVTYSLVPEPSGIALLGLGALGLLLRRSRAAA